jgi:hypothetical protein
MIGVFACLAVSSPNAFSFSFSSSHIDIGASFETFTFLNSIALDAHSQDSGGAIAVDSPRLSMTLTMSAFLKCSAASAGGAVCALAANAYITACCTLECASATAPAFFVNASGIGDNILLQSSLLVTAGRDVAVLARGEQNINSLNASSNSAESGASAVALRMASAANIDLSTFYKNQGDFVLDIRVSGRVSEVMACNFIQNTTGKGLLIRSAGMWTVKRSVFLRNQGNSFESVEDTLYLRNTFLDFEMGTLPRSVELLDVERGSDTPTHPITDPLRGYCPASGTPLTPMPSPTPGESPTASTETRGAGLSPQTTETGEPVATVHRTKLPEPSGGYFRVVICGFAALLAGIVAVALVAQGRVKRPVETQFVPDSGFIEPIATDESSADDRE